MASQSLDSAGQETLLYFNNIKDKLIIIRNSYPWKDTFYQIFHDTVSLTIKDVKVFLHIPTNCKKWAASDESCPSQFSNN
jgi:hypothetical protein